MGRVLISNLKLPIEKKRKSTEIYNNQIETIGHVIFTTYFTQKSLSQICSAES